jgi:hypothetical protein
MSHHAEERIKRLCSEALAVTTPEEVERVLSELRLALEEHVRAARNNLESSVIAFPFLDSLAKKRA